MTRSSISFWPEYLVKLTVNLDVGYGNAVFISGDSIGNNQQAERLYCDAHDQWTINIDRSKLKNGDKFQFYIGPYEAGEHPQVSQLSRQEIKNHYLMRKADHSPVFTLDLNDFAAVVSSTKRHTK